MRAQALAAGASSSRIADVERITIEVVVIVADITDGVPTTEGADCEKSDPPPC